MIIIKDTADLFALTTFIKQTLSIKHSQAQQYTAYSMGLLSYNHAVSVVKASPAFCITDHDFVLRINELAGGDNVIEPKMLLAYAKRSESRQIVTPTAPSVLDIHETAVSESDFHIEDYTSFVFEVLNDFNGEPNSVVENACQDALKTPITIWERHTLAQSLYDLLKPHGFTVYDACKLGFECSECYMDTMAFEGTTYGIELVFYNESDDRYLGNDLNVTSFSLQINVVDDGVWDDLCTCHSIGVLKSAFTKYNIPVEVIAWAEQRFKTAIKVTAPLAGRLIWY